MALRWPTLVTSALLDKPGAGATTTGALDEAAVAGVLDFSDGATVLCAASCIDAVLGELVVLVFATLDTGNGEGPGVDDGGGGNGAMPTPFLSLAAAAAAALAYFRPSPAGLVGTGAGFIDELLEAPLPIVGRG